MVASLFTKLINMAILGAVVVWSACPVDINNLEMILQGTVKFQIG